MYPFGCGCPTHNCNEVAISLAQSADITVAGGNNDAYFALLLDSIICFIYNGLAFIYLYIVDSKKIKDLRDGGISS